VAVLLRNPAPPGGVSLWRITELEQIVFNRMATQDRVAGYGAEHAWRGKCKKYDLKIRKYETTKKCEYKGFAELKCKYGRTIRTTN
jgi:hypothetical protein